jgi:GT2 family glycosyltransferase
MTKCYSLAIIIVAYSGEDLLDRCLASIYRYNDLGDRLEVVVVDNNPGEELSYSELRSRYPSALFLKNQRNGFGRGNNLGAAATTAPFLLFLNPDTELIESIGKFTEDTFRANQRLGLFGVQLVYPDGGFNSSYELRDHSGFFLNQAMKIAKRIHYFDSNRMFTSGADMFMKREVFDRVGGFDEGLFMYYEESDITRRILSLGYKVMYFRNKKIIHVGGGVTKNNCNAYKRQLQAATYYYNKYNLDLVGMLRKEAIYAKLKRFFFRFIDAKRYNYYLKVVPIIEEHLNKVLNDEK